MYAERDFRTSDKQFAKLRVEMLATYVDDNVEWKIRAYTRKPRTTDWLRIKDWREVATIEQVRELQWEIIQAIKLREPWEL